VNLIEQGSKTCKATAVAQALNIITGKKHTQQLNAAMLLVRKLMVKYI